MDLAERHGVVVIQYRHQTEVRRVFPCADRLPSLLEQQIGIAWG